MPAPCMVLSSENEVVARISENKRKSLPEQANFSKVISEDFFGSTLSAKNTDSGCFLCHYPCNRWHVFRS
ncbi:MAG: hypothetical protein PVH56_12680, partial [Desulfobacterales bacterium]